MNWPEHTAAKDTEGRHKGLPQGLQITDHHLIRRIGTGSYGEVWLARNIIGSYRAVKLVFRAKFEDSAPYEREFRGIQKFEPVSRTHEGLVDVLQVGRNDQLGYFYYVMELADAAGGSTTETRGAKDDASPKSESVGAGDEVRGSGFSTASDFGSKPRSSEIYRPHTLREELKRQGRLPVDRCVEIGLSLTAALAHLHENGLVHRDIKPSNIIFVAGVPKLADIGLVADLDEAKSFVGTPGYIPPEGPGTPQADLYSLGKVLFEMATGRDRQEFPQLPNDLREDSSAAKLVEFNEILIKACEPDLRKRYESGTQLLTDLRLLQVGGSVKRRRRWEQFCQVNRWASVVLAMLLLVITATALILRSFKDTELRSTVPEVNDLVEQGNLCLLWATPQRYATARDYFSRAVKRDPNFVPAYFGLFRVGLEAGLKVQGEDISTVRAAATNLMRIAPTSAEARVAASNLKLLDGDVRGALKDAQLATQLNSASKQGRAYAHAACGFYLISCGEQEAALKEYQIAAHAFPSDPVLQHHLGHPYRVLHKLDLALAQYQKSIDLVPEYYDGHYCVGCIYEEQGEFSKAIDEFEKGDLIAGEDKAETKLRYTELRRAVREDPARGYWRKCLDLALRNSEPAPHEVAICLAHLGKTNEAYVWLDKALQQKKLQGLWFDLCWDHQDARFREIAQKVGLKP